MSHPCLTVSLALLAVASGWTNLYVQAASNLNVTFLAKPPAAALANVVEDHFIGISHELSSFATLWGESTDEQPSAMINYLHNLAARMSKPLRIRIGGNGMDGSTYVPRLTSVIQSTDPDAYFNDIPVDFGPAFFDILNGMSDKVGEMQFFIGLSMRTPDNFTNVQTLAVAAREKLGDRLDSLFLGNEPDLYAGHGERDAYNITAYIPEIGEAIDALVDAGAMQKNETIVGGPTICCSWDLDDILNAGLDEYPYNYYSVQRYPNHACSGVTAENTNISYYLSHSNVEPFLGWQTDGITRAKELNVPVVLSEYNSVACGGTNISSTFAMSLWAVDVGLKAATMNYSAVFLHTREYGIQYNLYDPPAPETSTESSWRTGSPYYGALFLSETTSASGSVVVDLNLDNSTMSTNATVASYAIYDDAGATRSKLVFINYDNSSSRVFILPTNLTETLQYKILTAPDVWENTEISWAGQTVGVNGNLEGDEEIIEMNCSSGCRITVPGPGAALIALVEGGLFTGNSTIAGIGGYISGATHPTVPSLVIRLSGFLVGLFTLLYHL